MLSIYDYDDYRAFLNAWIKGAKNSGRGLKGQLAKAAGVSSTLISLILKGDKQLSLEQALEVAQFFNLNEKETDYFMLLVEFGRAGSFNLKQRLENKIKKIKNAAQKISHRVPESIKLSDEVKAIYYSDWIFTAVRNLTATENGENVVTIANHLRQTPNKINQVVDFLLEHGLCRQENGRLTYGPAHTHLTIDSPFVNRHHQNWRLKGFEKMSTVKHENELFYTCPMSCSLEVTKKIRTLILNTIDQSLKLSGPSTSEATYCINIDWFEF